MNKTLRRLFTGLMFVLTTVALAFAWVKLQASISGVSVAMVGGNSLTACETSDGTFKRNVAFNKSFELGCATSTDGITFTNEKGETSTEYGEFDIYLKATERKYLGVAVTSDCDSDGLRVSCTFNGVTKIFTPDDTDTVMFDKQLSTNGVGDVKVRVWFDGETTTEPVEASNIGFVFELR